MTKIKHVSHYEDYKLYVELSNGLRGLFDVSPYLEFGIFTQLKNRDYFKTVNINFCGICWPNGQDFSADTIEYTMEVWDEVSTDKSHPVAEIAQEHSNQMPYEEDEMLPEYDLENRQGVRGKYYHSTRESHAVHVYRDDGSVQKHYYTLEDGAVMLEPDVRRYFPDSESVNRVLRALIALIPEKSKPIIEETLVSNERAE